MRLIQHNYDHQNKKKKEIVKKFISIYANMLDGDAMFTVFDL